MPTVIERGGVRVSVYIRDHQPPHVHVKTGSGKAIVYLSEGELSQYEADLSITKSDIRKAVNVVEAHLAECRAMWRKYHR